MWYPDDSYNDPFDPDYSYDSQEDECSHQEDDDRELTWEEKVQDFIDEMDDLGVDLYSWK